MELAALENSILMQWINSSEVSLRILKILNDLGIKDSQSIMAYQPEIYLLAIRILESIEATRSVKLTDDTLRKLCAEEINGLKEPHFAIDILYKAIKLYEKQYPVNKLSLLSYLLDYSKAKADAIFKDRKTPDMVVQFQRYLIKFWDTEDVMLEADGRFLKDYSFQLEYIYSLDIDGFPEKKDIIIKAPDFRGGEKRELKNRQDKK